MSRWPWPRRSSFFLTVLAIHALLVIYWFSRDDTAVSSPPSPLTQPLEITTHCLTSFPSLYHEIDRSIHLWKTTKNHTLTPTDASISWHPTGPLDGGALRILIHNNHLRILESRNAVRDPVFRERALGVLHLLHRALQSTDEVLPTIETAIVLQDISYPPTEDGTHSFWTFARPYRDVHFNRTAESEGEILRYERYLSAETFARVWVIPNFDFWATASIGKFDDMRQRAREHDWPFEEKIPQVVWRGTQWTNPTIRSALVNITKGKDWADAAYTSPFSNDNHIPTPDMCAYAMTIHTEGFSYSGRLTHLLSCASLPFVHNLTYTTHYYHLLRSEGAEQNYVPVRDDFSDLSQKVEYYLSHPDEAQRIISNHLATFRERYLTTQATDCYFMHLIKGYASVSFTPEIDHFALPGRDFHAFIDHPEDFP
ncbi:unnamed protein product [Zymoseptoria tritici ST99CH_3D1]|nr:unnamed protein product [Zymoseptoria tritici ST99CH_3D1]